jgi:hypothetical protein
LGPNSHFNTIGPDSQEGPEKEDEVPSFSVEKLHISCRVESARLKKVVEKNLSLELGTSDLCLKS